MVLGDPRGGNIYIYITQHEEFEEEEIGLSKGIHGTSWRGWRWGWNLGFIQNKRAVNTENLPQSFRGYRSHSSASAAHWHPAAGWGMRFSDIALKILLRVTSGGTRVTRLWWKNTALVEQRHSCCVCTENSIWYSHRSFTFVIGVKMIADEKRKMNVDGR